MTRFVIILTVLFVPSLLSCTKSKLQREMMGDSTWETSGDEELWTPEERSPEVEEGWEEQSAPSSEESSEPESNVMAPRRKSGVIERDELNSVLDDGLGRYLQNVETEPVFDRGRFVGFRIIELFPGDLTYASLDLRPGDVVTRINDKPISRPEHASAIWKELRSASDLVVDYERSGEHLSMRFVIVDGA